MIKKPPWNGARIVMKVGVIGAGGTGGLYGAMLAESGEEVSLLARGAHLEAIRKHGIKVKRPTSKDIQVKLEATSKPEDIGPVDLLLFCVKNYDTQEVLPQLLPMLKDETVVLSLQNGVEKEETMGRVLGKEKVLGGTTFVNSFVLEPGVIMDAGNVRRIVFGELDGRITNRAQRIDSAFSKAGITSVLSRNIRKDIWLKFIRVCSYGGMILITRSTLQEIIDFPETRKLYLDALREGEAVARGMAIDIDPGTADVIFEDTSKNAKYANMSMLADLEKRKRTETDWLNGAIVRLGRRIGVPTPIHEMISASIGLMDFKNSRPP